MRITCSRNQDIRNLMKEKGVACWRIAEVMNCCENTVIRKLRSEMTESEKQKIVAAIEAAAAKIEEEK